MADKDYSSAVLPVSATTQTEETEKAKNIEGLYFISPTSDPADYSPNFSLKKLQQTTFETTTPPPDPDLLARSSNSLRPQLPKLEQEKSDNTKNITPLGIEIADAIQRNEKLLQNMVEVLIRNIHSDSEGIIKLSKEDEKNLSDLIDQLSKKENTDTVKRLLNIVTASTAITVGTILLAPESIAAIMAIETAAAVYSSMWSYLLIVTSVSNIIINEVMPRIGGYEKIASFFTSNELDRKNLANNIQITTSLANTVMGLVSSIAVSPLLEVVLNWSHGLKFLNTTLELSNGATNFVSDLNDHSYNSLLAKQTLHDGKTKIAQTNLDKDFLQLQSATDMQQAFNNICFNIFETLKKIQEQNIK